MLITLAPGEMLQVAFANTDGQFNIHFNSDEFPDAIAVEEVSGCTPNTVGHTGVLYHDKFEDAVGAENSVEVANESDTRHVGKHPSLSQAYGIKKEQPTKPSGFFRDSQGKIHSTELVRCQIVEGGWKTGAVWPEVMLLVEALDDTDEVVGTFDFYPSLEAMAAETQIEVQLEVVK